MERRQLLKVAGLGVVGSVLGPVAAQPEPATSGQAREREEPKPKTLAVSISGLIVLEHNSTDLVSRLIKSNEHQPRLVARMLDVVTQPEKPHAVIVTPAGVQFGMWNIKNWNLSVKGLGAGGVTFENNNEEKCPTADAHWVGVNRLMDLKYLDSQAKSNPGKGASTFTLTKGSARCLPPQNLQARTTEWEFKEGAEARVTKPLSDLVRVTVDYSVSVYELVDTGKNKTLVTLAPPEGDVVEIAIFNLPDPSGMPGHRSMSRDLPHANTLLKAVDSAKQYTTTAYTCSRMGQDAQLSRGIEPIFCPPGYLPG